VTRYRPVHIIGQVITAAALRRFAFSATLGVLVAARLLAQGPVPPFVVAVSGDNDTLLPFADFDGQRWRSSWRPPGEEAPDPLPLEQIPPAWWGRSAFQPAWEVLDPATGRRQLQVVGTEATGLGSGCSWNLGLKTDGSNRTYPRGHTIAASRPGVVSPVESSSRDSAEWHAVAALLPWIYQQHEALAWKDTREAWRPALVGRLATPVLEAVFMTSDEQGQYVYFESRRDFTRRPNQLGDDHSFITAWLWRRSPEAAFQSIDVGAGRQDPDGKGAPSFLPLGVIRHGAQRFWLGSYAYGGLTVLDVRRSGVTSLLRVDYPGC
jgi:hypothetical protein